MKKMTWRELVELFTRHNDNATDNTPDLTGGVCFKSENWPDEDYSEESRTYEFSSCNKYFKNDKIGKSIFSDCKDGSDCGVRLDRYIDAWDIEYCYVND